MALVYPEELRAAAHLPAPPLPAAAAKILTAVEAASSAVPRRALGKSGLAVAPLGLSGAGELTAPCFEAARDAGVSLFFWEPQHRGLTAFAARAARRHDLQRLKEQGKVRAIGFSTHLRDLAEEAISMQAWDVVMCRLSAAHPGAERSLLPAAASRGVGVIAFSALCYGRMLSGPEGVTAADCYRYCLSRPGVSVCLSAPRRWRELSENLTVLERPELDPLDIERLKARGERVRADNRAFTALVHRA